MDFSWAYSIDPKLATVLLSMLPIAELRVSIPLALSHFHLPWQQALVLAVLGSYIPALLILYFVGPISFYLRRWSIFERFFSWLFARTRNKFDEKYNLWGNLALMIFVAIPLPVTGVWTGSLAAWLFGIRNRTALLYIALGTTIAGVIVTLISLGVLKAFDFLL